MTPEQMRIRIAHLEAENARLQRDVDTGNRLALDFMEARGIGPERTLVTVWDRSTGPEYDPAAAAIPDVARPGVICVCGSVVLIDKWPTDHGVSVSARGARFIACPTCGDPVAAAPGEEKTP